MDTPGGLLSLRQCAERLGMSERRLRDLARSGRLPASKQAGRWLVTLADAEHARSFRGAGPRRVRGRLAEGVALDDLTHRLLHTGTVAADPTPRGRQSPARAAEAEAIEHQLRPGEVGDRPLALPAGLKGRARAAQSKALEHMEDRLDRPHPPERSI